MLIVNWSLYWNINDLISSRTYVKQNAANGTDHGAASNLFIIGNQLKTPGFYNDLASLSDLDDNGDLRYTVDFRSIYATILDKWLAVEDQTILNASFPKLQLL